MRSCKPWLLIWLCLALAPLTGLVIGQEKEARLATSELVATQQGELPIILSAPHGGEKAIPGVPIRLGEGLVKGPSGFVTGRDSGTEQLCYEVAKAIEAKMGKKPYYVAARFHRKYLDPNRPPEIAFEHPLAKPVYQVYHDTLARYCLDVKKKYGRGLLLDIHGQGSAKDTVFRGTKNGKTVTFVQRYGDKAHNGPKSFFGLMDAQKMKVFPTDDRNERSGYTGGFIVQTYGSHKTHAIDAIQLEFGGDYRAKEKQKETAAKLATVVDEFARLYIFDRK